MADGRDGRAVSHWTLWVRDADAWSFDTVCALCRRELARDDIVVLRNDVAVQSVPEMAHYHVFWCA